MADGSIHPTAVVDPAARLGAGVTLGPYAVIEGPAEVADGCVIEAHATLTGAVRLGQGCAWGTAAVLGGWPQDFAFDPATDERRRGGRGEQIREHCTIHRGTAAGTRHAAGRAVFADGRGAPGAQRAGGGRRGHRQPRLLGGYVEIGDRVFVGGGSVFHQFVRVGRGAMIQGLSAFSKDVPPFALGAERNLVFGLNVVGLRRTGFSAAERAEIKEAFRLLYGAGMNVSQALAAARERTWGAAAAEVFAFAEGAKKRGLSAFKRREPEV